MRLKDLEPQILQNRLSFVRYIQDAITKQRETHMNTLVIGWELSFLVCLRSITFRRTQNRTANRQLGQTDTLFSLSGSGAINSIRIELCKRCGDLATCGRSKTASFAADYRCIVTQMKGRTTDHLRLELVCNFRACAVEYPPSFRPIDLSSAARTNDGKSLQICLTQAESNKNSVVRVDWRRMAINHAGPRQIRDTNTKMDSFLIQFILTISINRTLLYSGQQQKTPVTVISTVTILVSIPPDI